MARKNNTMEVNCFSPKNQAKTVTKKDIIKLLIIRFLSRSSYTFHANNGASEIAISITTEIGILVAL